MNDYMIEAFEDRRDFWLSARFLTRFFAGFSLLAAIAYPVVLLTLHRWAGFQGFAVSLGGVALFWGLGKFCDGRADALSSMLHGEPTSS